MNPIIIKTPAKINLYLKINGIDPVTSLHRLESLMSPIDFYDELVISPSSEMSVKTEGIAENIPTEKNIVCRIFRQTEKFTGSALPCFDVTIKKNIPTGAGLGGGSGNGAGFLMFLNRHLDLKLSMDDMVTIAAGTGSDIPVFLFNSPAIVSGTGEKIEPLKIQDPGFFMFMIYPDIIVNTALAYALFDKKKLTKSTALNINTVRKSVNGSLKDWIPVFFNDFEGVVFQNWPAIEELKNSLENCGPEKVFMSGSGSSLVAVFGSEKTRDETYDKFKGKYRIVRKIRLLTG